MNASVERSNWLVRGACVRRLWAEWVESVRGNPEPGIPGCQGWGLRRVRETAGAGKLPSLRGPSSQPEPTRIGLARSGVDRTGPLAPLSFGAKCCTRCAV